ncbi:MAG: hypothetical protein ACYTDT_06565 [Planctomycetota bacterium]|jgi:tetratricopeptide (TPR) repeat protein
MRLCAALSILALLVISCASTPAKDAEDKSTNQPDRSNKTTPEKDATDLLRVADDLFGSRNYADARDRYIEAAELALKAGDNSTRTEALAQVARMHMRLQTPTEGLSYLKDATSIALEAEPRGWSRYLGVRGRYEWLLEKDFDKAKATFKEYYDYCLPFDDKVMLNRTIDAAHMLAIVGTDDEKIEWALKTIEAAESADETGWLGPLWNNLGWTYDERDETDKALHALKNAQKYHYMGESDHAKMVADFGVAHALRRVGELKESRELLDKTMSWAEERLRHNPEGSDEIEWMGWGHINNGDLLQDEGKPSEALAEYELGRPYLIKAGIENWGRDWLKTVDAKIAKLSK